MRIVRNTILSVIISLALFSNLFAQGSFDIHVGTAIPVSDISYGAVSIDSDDVVYGTAVAGLNIGFQYNYQITTSGLGVYAGLDFTYNGINKAYKDEMEKFFSLFGIDDYKFEAFYNIPLSLGGFYKYSVNDNIALYGNAGATFNFFKMSDFVMGDRTLEADWSNNLGFMVGAAIIYKDRVSFQVNYLGLGKHEFTVVDPSTPEFPSDVEKEINMLTIGIGLSF